MKCVYIYIVNTLRVSFVLCTGLLAGIVFANYAHASDLDYLLPTQHLTTVSVDVNIDTTPTTVNVPIIKTDARQAIVKGVIVFIADIQPQGANDQTLIKLSQRLPDWGWHTLYVTPTPSYFTAPLTSVPSTSESSSDSSSSSASSSNENTQEQEQEQPLSNEIRSIQTALKPHQLQAPQLTYSAQQYNEFTLALLNAIQLQFIQSPGYSVIYAKGKSAASTLAALSQAQQNGNNDLANALVINSPYWPQPAINQSVVKKLASSTIPVLDLVGDSDNQFAKLTRQQRLVETKVSLKPVYRQRQIIGIGINNQHVDYVAKEMVGFMTYLGW